MADTKDVVAEEKSVFVEAQEKKEEELKNLLDKHNVYSKNLSTDLITFFSTQKVKPSYLKKTSFTEGVISAPDENHTLTVCGMSRKAWELFGTKVSNELKKISEVKDITFRDCVLEMRGITFERNVGKYKRGDEVPLLSTIKPNSEVEELLTGIPQVILTMVYEAAFYLREIQEDELKNLNMPSKS